MVNLIWVGMLLTGIVVAAMNGNIEEITSASLKGAQWAVEFAIGLISIMAFWLGMMKVAEEAGLVRLLARLVKPLSAFLFPSLPKDHPAMGAIIMNLSANVLGLGNAATPMGLIAMKELQTLNKGDPDTATDAMCTFLALNTSCITIIPATIIGIRIQSGSTNPTEIVGTTIFATAIAMTVAVLADRILRRVFRARSR